MSSNANALAQKFTTFQEQELHDELGLNWLSYKYRFYDPSIARFFNVDPLTEDYVDWGPYVFSGNIVINARELEGLEPIYSHFGMEYYPRNGNSPKEQYDKVQKAKYAEGAGTLIGVAAWVVPATVVAVGPRATASFVLNEVKDEALSQATGGASDVFDLTKMAKNGIEAGIKKIKNHLSNPDLNLDPDVANDVMLDDLQKIANGEMEATPQHNNYFNHELKESDHVANGLSYDEAHKQTLKDQGIDSKTSESQLYTDEAIRKGNEAFEKEANDKLKSKN